MKRLLTATAIAILLVAQSDVCRGQWVRMGPFGGQIQAIAVNGSTLFAGLNGNWGETIYRSTDSGKSWNGTNKLLSGSSTTCFAVLGNLVFAGGDEGVFRSTDNGGSWTLADSGLSENVNCLMAIGPNLLGGSYDGVFRSSDSGFTWARTGSGVFSGAVQTIGAVDSVLVLDAGGNIYFSTDSGKSWDQTTQYVYSGIGTTPSSFATIGSTLFWVTGSEGFDNSTDNGFHWLRTDSGAATCAFASGSVIFAGIPFGVDISTDTGRSWTRETNGPNSSSVNCFVQLGNKLFAGTNDGIFVSSDNGIKWNSSSIGLPTYDIQSLISMGDDLLAATSYKVFFSSDGGASWQLLPSALHGTYIATLQNCDDIVLAGTIYSGGEGIFLSSDEGHHWSLEDSGVGGIDCYAGNNTDLFAGGYALYHSTDAGNHWLLNSTISPQPTIALAVSDSTLVAATTSNIFLSKNDGVDWRNINDSFSNFYSVAILNGTIYAGTFRGLFRSSDDGNNWASVLSGDSLGGGVSTLFLMDSDLFAGTSYGACVLLSSDNGDTWQTEKEGMGNTSVYQFTRIGNYLFAGTDSGVWRRPISEMTASSSVARSLPSNSTISIYPNPFTQSTTITFSSQDEGYADVTVVNLLGVQVARIFYGELSAGEHSFSWDASGMPPGMYECLVRINGQVQRVSMVLVRD